MNVITVSELLFSGTYSTGQLQQYLDQRSVPTIVGELYLFAGDPPKEAGWILHVSVSQNQVEQMLDAVIPELIAQKISFRIPKDASVLQATLLGGLGTIKLGKILTVYPVDDINALETAELLVRLTSIFTTLPVPTDIHLKHCVYTRLGKLLPYQRPLTAMEEAKPLYNLLGEKIDNIQFDPYAFPEPVHWPFEAITTLQKPIKQKIIAGKYYPVTFLRQSLKGHVFLAKYMRGILPATCVLKQAFAGVSADDLSRDLRNRLSWQTEILNELAPLRIGPRAIELFSDGDALYLAMERIKGTTIKDFVAAIRKGRLWQDLTIKEKQRLISCAITLVQTLQRIHQQGYVHRDLNSENFVIESSGDIRILDFELSYNLKKNDPPFDGGSKGYMSPEQKALNRPTAGEDVYSIGGLLTHFFVGLSPRQFDELPEGEKSRRILFLTQESRIVELIIRCQNPDPQLRPSLKEIISNLEQLKSSALSSVQVDFTSHTHGAISRSQRLADQLSQELQSSTGEYKQILEHLPAFQILNLVAASDLVNDSKVEHSDLPGVNHLLRSNYLARLCGSDFQQPSVSQQNFIDAIASSQQPKGYWISSDTQIAKQQILLGLDQGVAGKALLLLYQYAQTQNQVYRIAVEKSIRYLSAQLKTHENAFGWPSRQGLSYPTMLGMSEGSVGIILLYLQAFQLFNEKAYQQIVEKVIFSLPPRLALGEYSFDLGMIGLAHIHLQGYLTFGTASWLERLNWSVAFLTSTFRDDEPIQKLEDLTDRYALADLLLQYQTHLGSKQPTIALTKS